MQSQLRNVALYLAVIQFFFFTTWIVYVVYLGDLLDQVGIGRDKLLWFIALDQLLFALADTYMGFRADKVEKAIGRLGPMILAFNAVSCIAFIALPFVADLGGENATGIQALWIALLVIWIASSSVLRAPPVVLLMKYAAKPQVPHLAALILLGLALGGAISPYLGLVLKEFSAYVPFALTGLTLFLTTLGLIWVERIPRPATDYTPPAPVPKQFFWPILLTLLGASVFLGLGFQIHYFFNAKASFLQFAEKEYLMWLLPVFWIGFKMLVFPGSSLARRFGAMSIMSIVTPIAVLGTSLVALSSTLNMLIVAQFLTGAAWGILFMAGITASLSLGQGGREGRVLGLWFSMLSATAFIRVMLALNDFNPKKMPESSLIFDWLPAFLWGIAALLLYIAWRYYRSYQASLDNHAQ